VVIEIGEGLPGPGGPEPGLLLDVRLELVVGEGQHAAVGVMNQHDLVGSGQPLADGEGPDRILRRGSAGGISKARASPVLSPSPSNSGQSRPR